MSESGICVNHHVQLPEHVHLAFLVASTRHLLWLQSVKPCFCCQNNHQVMINFAKLMDSISSGFNPFVIQLFRSRSMLQMTNTCQGTSNSDTCAIGQSDPRSEAGAEHAAGLVSRWLCCSLGFKSCTEYRFKKNH